VATRGAAVNAAADGSESSQPQPPAVAAAVARVGQDPQESARLLGFIPAYVSGKLARVAGVAGAPELAAPGLYVSGQPAEADLARAARDLGIRTVINLRARAEAGALGRGVLAREPAIAAELGMAYVSIETSSGGDAAAGGGVSAEALAALDAALAAAERPAWVHCDTGSRAKSAVANIIV
jgi:uncharacterized protein (TIGR01244 family)